MAWLVTPLEARRPNSLPRSESKEFPMCSQGQAALSFDQPKERDDG